MWLFGEGEEYGRAGGEEFKAYVLGGCFSVCLF